MPVRGRWRERTRPSGLPTPAPERFHLVLTYYQREPAYSLGLACISAYVKRELDGVSVHLVPLFRGDEPDEYVRHVTALEPHLIAIAAMHPTWIPTHPYLAALKRACPDTPVIVGGYQTIVSPRETLAHPGVDYVCLGDGEESMVGLIRRLRGETDRTLAIPGVLERATTDAQPDAAPVLVRDLRDMPFPDYTIFERDGDVSYLSPRAVQSRSLTTLPVVSGRGCPYRCTYCANTTLLEMYGGKGGLLRKYDSEAFVAELARLRDRYGVDFFQFWDEEFVYDRRYTDRLLELYRDVVGRPFSMFVRVEGMSESLCKLAAACGCHSMWFGVESGSESYRRTQLNRRMSNQQILDAAATARRHGIKLMAFNMVGMPFETLDDIRATFTLTQAIAPDLTVVSQYLPLPGTPMYEVVRRHDLLLPESEEQQMWPLGRLNIREHNGGISAHEMRDVAAEIMQYVEEYTNCDA